MYQLKYKNNDTILKQETYPMPDGTELVLLKYPLLEQTGIVGHCFSTRYGGVSEGFLGSMNLSFSRGDKKENVEENFRRITSVLGKSTKDLVFTDQTHTTNVRKVTAEDAGCGIVKDRGYTDIDGLITDEPGLVLATFYADCVPLYFVDPVHRAIGQWKEHMEQSRRMSSVPSDHPSVRNVMKSVKMWRKHFKGNLGAEKRKF